MGMQNGLIHFAVVHAPQFPKHLFMYLVKDGPEFRLAGVLHRVGVWHRLVPKEIPVLFRNQFGVLGLRSSNAPQRKTVLGIRQVADLPGGMADPSRRLSKPLGNWRLVKKSDGVIAGEDDLLDGKFQPIHGYISFAGSAPTNFTAR